MATVKSSRSGQMTVRSIPTMMKRRILIKTSSTNRNFQKAKSKRIMNFEASLALSPHLEIQVTRIT